MNPSLSRIMKFYLSLRQFELVNILGASDHGIVVLVLVNIVIHEASHDLSVTSFLL